MNLVQGPGGGAHIPDMGRKSSHSGLGLGGWRFPPRLGWRFANLGGGAAASAPLLASSLPLSPGTDQYGHTGATGEAGGGEKRVLNQKQNFWLSFPFFKIKRNGHQPMAN